MLVMRLLKLTATLYVIMIFLLIDGIAAVVSGDAGGAGGAAVG